MAEDFHAGICGETWWNWNPTKTMFTGCNSSLYSDNNGATTSLSIDSTLQMMGFDLSSTTSDWNQTLLVDSFKPINQEFSMGSTASYECPSTLLQTIFESDHNHPQHVPQEESIFNNYTTSSATYGAAPSVRPPLTKQQPGGSLHFSNNSSIYSAAGVNNIKSGFLLSRLEEKPSCSGLTTKTNIEKIRNSESVMKKGSNIEAPLKRQRLETPLPLPTFKVRKEKLGDRITALQQLVSPFGKTDTASVLHEAIEYIKFLHDQVNVLSSPYMKQGAASIQQLQQQITDKLENPEGPKEDLRSRGLCLVPVSSTFPVANETPADFWTPTFGGTFR